jgi:hypothetical protein
MKTVSRFIVALMGLGVVLTACDQREFDMPPLNEPVYSDTATLTIAAFKAKYAGVAVTQITDDDVISGIVVANDISGNFYKELTIMDSTGGLKVAINQGDLYTQFRLGQQVFIECKDLYVGKYGGYMQLGGPYNTGIGQMTWEVAQAHVFRDGWPEPDNALLTPEVVSMNTVAAEANLGKLITLENVFFATGGTEVCAPVATDGSTQTVSKTLSSTDFPGKTLVVRLSSASDFANKTLPAGNGNLTGILSVYNNTYQFTPRDSMDFAFVGFGAGFVSQGSGTKADPYLVGYALSHQSIGKMAWVKGYIVGALNSGVSMDNPLTGNEGIKWTAPFMENTLVIAADSLETDWSKCLVVNLPAASSLRDSVNLNTHPENLGRLIAVVGSFETYSGAPGVLMYAGDVAEYWLDEPSTTGTDPEPGNEGDGTAAKPYSVAQAKLKQGETGKWVTGYIVGFINTSSSPYTYTYSASGAIASNLLLADSPTETADGNCVPVQLSYGTDPRTALNLLDNPAKLGTQVSVQGSLEAYFSVPGIKSLTAYALGSTGTGGSDPDPEPGTTIYSETFAISLGGFAGVSVAGAEVWAHDSYGYAKMSGYANSRSNANEDWLISPAINLSAVSAAVVSFKHTINKGDVANLTTNHTLWVSTNYTSGAPSTATWTQVPITTYPTGADWIFVSSGNISLPTAIMGQSNVRLAFKYLCSDSESATWEIKELVVQ